MSVTFWGTTCVYRSVRVTSGRPSMNTRALAFSGVPVLLVALPGTRRGQSAADRSLPNKEIIPNLTSAGRRRRDVKLRKNHCPIQTEGRQVRCGVRPVERRDRRPEALGSGGVPLVEKRFESFQHESLILFCDSPTHVYSSSGHSSDMRERVRQGKSLCWLDDLGASHRGPRSAKNHFHLIRTHIRPPEPCGRT